jgi:hypothetical protein
MQRSKPERASAVDGHASLEDVFASRNFGKPLSDGGSFGSASAMADAFGPRAAGIVKNRFIATVSVAAAVLSLVVVAASTGTVKVPTLSAANAGAPGQTNPDFSNPALGGSGTGNGSDSNGSGSVTAPPAAPSAPATSSPGGVPVSTSQGSATATVANFTPSNSNSTGTNASVALNELAAKAPVTTTTVPPAPTTTTTAPPTTTTTTTTPPVQTGGATGNGHRGQGPGWGGSGPGDCNSQSNGHVVQTCP